MTNPEKKEKPKWTAPVLTRLGTLSDVAGSKKQSFNGVNNLRNS